MEDDRLLDENDVLLDALAAGLTHSEAAVLAGVSSKTVQRRLKGSDFAAELARRHSMRVVELTGQLTALAPAAVAGADRGDGVRETVGAASGGRADVPVDDPASARGRLRFAFEQTGTRQRRGLRG